MQNLIFVFWIFTLAFYDFIRLYVYPVEAGVLIAAFHRALGYVTDGKILGDEIIWQDINQGRMVNINVFGRVTDGKKDAMEEGKVATVFDNRDAENAMLVQDRSTRRKKFACLTCVADLCALGVVVLIVLATSMLLMRLWWVKTEVDQMEPAVQRVMNDIARLKEQAQAIQAQNAMLIQNAQMQTASDAVNNNDKDLFPTEDTSHQALLFFAAEASDDDTSAKADEQSSDDDFLNQVMQSLLLNLDQSPDVGKMPSTTGTDNLTAELVALHAAEQAALKQSAEDAVDMPELKPALNTGSWLSLNAKKFGLTEEDDDDDDVDDDSSEEDRIIKKLFDSEGEDDSDDDQSTRNSKV